MIKMIFSNLEIIGFILTASSTVLIDKALSKKSFSDSPLAIKFSLT